MARPCAKLIIAVFGWVVQSNFGAGPNLRMAFRCIRLSGHPLAVAALVVVAGVVVEANDADPDFSGRGFHVLEGFGDLGVAHGAESAAKLDQNDAFFCQFDGFFAGHVIAADPYHDHLALAQIHDGPHGFFFAGGTDEHKTDFSFHDLPFLSLSYGPVIDIIYCKFNKEKSK